MASEPRRSSTGSSRPSFDLHAERHRLKQLRDSGDSSLFENRDAVCCPVCASPFDRLFTTTEAARSFPENDGARFCLLRDGEALHLFRH